ncbi:MAG: NAD(P)-dependent oxidoreductase [Roseivivax sp.]|nr:NAD(P)-dependent oxidoreductase [Roseivivax sp.]
MSDKPAIGFIGVGLMGHGMAANILKGGYSLTVMGNRNRAPVEDLLAHGATEVTSAREMAQRCDVICLCLPNSDLVEALMLGPDGIIENARPGLTVIDSTTANPTSTEALARQMAARGLHLVDAPLGRTPKEAEAGTLDAMVGGDDATVARVRPIIDCWAGVVNHVGPVGAAHKMKLIMNFLSMGYAAMYSEATVLAAKVGLPPQAVRDVIGASRLSNGFFETFMKYAVGRDRDAHKFSIANGSKDVRYLANMASDAGVVNILGAAVKHYFTHAEAIGKGDHYVPMLSDIIADMNGLDLAEAVARGEKAR